LVITAYMTVDTKSKGKIINLCNSAALQHIRKSNTYVIYLIKVNDSPTMVFLTYIKFLGIYKQVGVVYNITCYIQLHSFH